MMLTPQNGKEEFLIVATSFLGNSMLQCLAVPLVKQLLYLRQVLLSSRHYHSCYRILISSALMHCIAQNLMTNKNDSPCVRPINDKVADYDTFTQIGMRRDPQII